MIRYLRARTLGRFYLVLALATLSALTGMATSFGLFYRVLYVLGLTVAVAYLWNLISLLALNVDVNRRTSRVRVGDPIEEGFTAHNTGPLTKQSLIVEDLNDLPGVTIGAAVGLAAGAVTRWEGSGVAQKRGIYTLGPVRVSHTDPFGLFRRSRTFGDREEIVVYPRVFELPQFEVPSAYLIGEATAMIRTQTVSPQASTIRDYAFGDSMSRIHWKSTAKLGRLISKEFDQGRAGEVWIVLDLHRDYQFGELAESTDEYAVSIAASLAKRHIQGQLPLGLVAYGARRHVLRAEPGFGQFDRVLDNLAVSVAEGTVPLDGVLAREELLWTNRSSLIVVTPSPDPAWVAGLRELAKRGVKATAVVIDGSSFGGRRDSVRLLDHLLGSGVQSYVVRKGDNIASALSRVYLRADAPAGETLEAVAANA